MAQLLGERAHQGGRLQGEGVVHPRRQHGALEAATEDRVSGQRSGRLPAAVTPGCWDRLNSWKTRGDQLPSYATGVGTLPVRLDGSLPKNSTLTA